jgi:hypothetical protein
MVSFALTKNVVMFRNNIHTDIYEEKMILCIYNANAKAPDLMHFLAAATTEQQATLFLANHD